MVNYLRYQEQNLLSVSNDATTFLYETIPMRKVNAKKQQLKATKLMVIIL